jgi:putative component of membrane protein insertase Oxa1/YidC/SpoIIIJ protein YidD
LKNFFFWLLLPTLLTADPWGKDADLAIQKKSASKPPCCITPILSSVGTCLIRFHQEVISPADGPRSHYFPSSSQYTLEAIQKYGFFSGVTMGCDRLMRENSDPWVYRTTIGKDGKRIKSDPVR